MNGYLITSNGVFVFPIQSLYNLLLYICLHASNEETSVDFVFVVLPSSTYLFTVGVGGFYFHLITLKHTPQSVGLLWTWDRPVAETST
jgi:hypothetical protein